MWKFPQTSPVEICIHSNVKWCTRGWARDPLCTSAARVRVGKKVVAVAYTHRFCWQPAPRLFTPAAAPTHSHNPYILINLGTCSTKQPLDFVRTHFLPLTRHPHSIDPWQTVNPAGALTIVHFRLLMPRAPYQMLPACTRPWKWIPKSIPCPPQHWGQLMRCRNFHWQMQSLTFQSQSGILHYNIT